MAEGAGEGEGSKWRITVCSDGTWRMARNSEPALPNATLVKRGRLPEKLRHLVQWRILLMRIKLIASCSFKFETVVQYAFLNYDVFSYWWLLTHAEKNIECIMVKLNINFSFTLSLRRSRNFLGWDRKYLNFWYQSLMSSGNTIITLQVIWKVYKVWSKSPESEKVLARN